MITLTPPACEPLHIDDVRQHLKQDITDDDNLIGIYLASARDYAQKITSKQLIAARFVIKKSSLGQLKITRGPVVAIESIRYKDTQSQWQTLAADAYTLDASNHVAVVDIANGYSWPSTDGNANSVEIIFIAGYVTQAMFNATANTVTIKNWPTLKVGDVIRLSNSGGGLPYGLQPKTDYYIQSVASPNSYTLAIAMDGTPIDIADIGSGTHFLGQPGINLSDGEIPGTFRAWLLLRCDTAYSHRGETVNAKAQLSPLPYVDRLLDNDRHWQ